MKCSGIFLMDNVRRLVVVGFNLKCVLAILATRLRGQFHWPRVFSIRFPHPPTQYGEVSDGADASCMLNAGLVNDASTQPTCEKA